MKFGFPFSLALIMMSLWSCGDTNPTEIDSNSDRVEMKSGADSTLAFYLPDSSYITLNKNSSLSYSKESFESERSVELSGEAFLEVSHDANAPFSVSAGDAKITVLGTSFNVKADEDVEVEVYSGSVELSSDSNGKKSSSKINANEKGSYSKKSRKISKGKNKGKWPKWMKDLRNDPVESFKKVDKKINDKLKTLY